MGTWAAPSLAQPLLCGCLGVTGDRDSSPWPKYFDNDFSGTAQSLAVLLTVGAVGKTSLSPSSTWSFWENKGGNPSPAHLVIF